MFIQTENTPNPQALKFLPQRPMGGLEGQTFQGQGTSFDHPLVTALMSIEGVMQVFFGQDFVTVTKTQDTAWVHIKPLVLGSIMDYFLEEGRFSYEPEMEEKAYGPTPRATNTFSPLEKEIHAIIEDRVRPAVAQDGGDIVFDRFEEGIVYVHLRGACSGCPSSTQTLKSGIENMLKYYVPEVIEVCAVQ